jgi:hypothetical protein
MVPGLSRILAVAAIAGAALSAPSGQTALANDISAMSKDDGGHYCLADSSLKVTRETEFQSDGDGWHKGDRSVDLTIHVANSCTFAIKVRILNNCDFGSQTQGDVWTPLDVPPGGTNMPRARLRPDCHPRLDEIAQDKRAPAAKPLASGVAKPLASPAAKPPRPANNEASAGVPDKPASKVATAKPERTPPPVKAPVPRPPAIAAAKAEPNSQPAAAPAEPLPTPPAAAKVEPAAPVPDQETPPAPPPVSVAKTEPPPAERQDAKPGASAPGVGRLDHCISASREAYSTSCKVIKCSPAGGGAEVCLDSVASVKKYCSSHAQLDGNMLLWTDCQ